MKANETQVYTSWRQLVNTICTELPTDYENWEKELVSCVNYFQQFRPDGMKTSFKQQTTTQRMRRILDVVMDMMRTTNPASSCFACFDEFRKDVLKSVEMYMSLPLDTCGKPFPSWSETLKNIKIGGIHERKMALLSVLWMFSLFTIHEEAWKFFLTFVAAPDPIIHDVQFMFVYIAGVSNAIGQHAYEKFDLVFKKNKKLLQYCPENRMRCVRAAFRQYFRLSFAYQIMKLLMDIGTQDQPQSVGHLVDFKILFDDSSFQYNPASNKEIAKNANTAYHGAIQPLLISWSKYVARNFEYTMRNYYEQGSRPLHLLYHLFPECIPRSRRHKELAEEQMLAKFSFTARGDDALVLLVPPALRIGPDIVNSILTGDKDWRQYFDNETFQGPPKPESKRSKKARRNREADDTFGSPESVSASVATSQASQPLAISVDDDEFVPEDVAIDSAAASGRASIPRSAKRKITYDNTSASDVQTKKSRHDITEVIATSELDLDGTVETSEGTKSWGELLSEHATLVAMSNHLTGWMEGEHPNMDVEAAVSAYMVQSLYYARLMTPADILVRSQTYELPLDKLQAFYQLAQGEPSASDTETDVIPQIQGTGTTTPENSKQPPSPVVTTTNETIDTEPPNEPDSKQAPANEEEKDDKDKDDKASPINNTTNKKQIDKESIENTTNPNESETNPPEDTT